MALDKDYFKGNGLDVSRKYSSEISHLEKVVGNEFGKSNRFQRTEAKEVLQDVIKAAQKMRGHSNKNRITNNELFGQNGVFSKLKSNPARYKREFGLDGYTNAEINELQNLFKYQAPEKKIVVPDEDLENN